MRKIQILMAITAFIYLILCGTLFFFQRNLLYFPSPINKHNYKSASFSNENELIDVITLNTENRKAILFFGGNAEAVVQGASSHISDFPNHAIYLVNYRGYGRSTGSPTEKGIYSDVLHIFDEIKEKHTTISVIGRSLGTGVATYVATKRKVEKVVLITPYDSIENLAVSQYSVFPVSLLLLDKYRSVDRVEKIKAKTLILFAENDRVIPLENSLKLIRKFKKTVLTVKTIKGKGHNNISRAEEYHSLLNRFMQ